jgi:hypothetical protein
MPFYCGKRSAGICVVLGLASAGISFPSQRRITRTDAPMISHHVINWHVERREISRREQRGLRNRSPEKAGAKREGPNSQRSSERPMYECDCTLNENVGQLGTFLPTTLPKNLYRRLSGSQRHSVPTAFQVSKMDNGRAAIIRSTHGGNTHDIQEDSTHDPRCCVAHRRRGVCE